MRNFLLVVIVGVALVAVAAIVAAGWRYTAIEVRGNAGRGDSSRAIILDRWTGQTRRVYGVGEK